jgi:hypothetical protein
VRKVALLIWHSRQTPPFAPQSMTSLKPSLVSAFVVDGPSSDLSSTKNFLDFVGLDGRDDQTLFLAFILLGKDGRVQSSGFGW